ncbi:hypothetical protein [Mycobacterium sp. IS-1496]|nr:hypothetical protein [Mycobacterium sp. IS-1496]
MSISDDWKMTDKPCGRCGAPLAEQTGPGGDQAAVRTRCTNDACPESRR